MRSGIILGAILAAALAAPQAAAQAPKVPTHYTLSVTLQELGVIGAALGDRPFKDVASLLANLNKQVQDQQSAASAPADKSNKPPAKK